METPPPLISWWWQCVYEVCGLWMEVDQWVWVWMVVCLYQPCDELTTCPGCFYGSSPNIIWHWLQLPCDPENFVVMENGWLMFSFSFVYYYTFIHTVVIRLHASTLHQRTAGETVLQGFRSWAPSPLMPLMSIQFSSQQPLVTTFIIGKLDSTCLWKNSC